MLSKLNNNKQQGGKKTRISRGWMVTINNPKIPGNAYLDQWIADGVIVFGCGQLERAPETGTPHLQMYVVTKANEKNPKGFSRKWVSDNIHSKAHLDNREGTHEEARDYCTLPVYKGKPKIVLAGPWTVGEWDEKNIEGKSKGGKAAGAKHKLNVEAMLNEVKEGQSDLYLMEKYPHLFLTMHKAVEKARLIYASTKPRQQPEVIVYYGATGTGKSHKANKVMISNGGGIVFHKGNHGNFWADGYDANRHPVVVFDEFDGSWFSYKQLLRVCDKWPYGLETKGGTVSFNPKIIVFTATKHPKEWYSETAVPDTTELMRRLSGKHGAIVNMTTKYDEPVSEEPDLVLRLDEIENGKPAERTATLSNTIPVGVDEDDDVDDKRPSVPIDLMAHEDIGHPTPPPIDDEAFLDMMECGMCGANARIGCDCFDPNASGDRSDTDSVEGDGYIDDEGVEGYTDDQFDDLRFAQRVTLAQKNEAKLMRRNAMTAQSTSDMTPKTSAAVIQPPAPRKRAADLFFEPPPKAPASEFKKLKQVPGQSRLIAVPHGDDDDEDVQQ